MRLSRLCDDAIGTMSSKGSGQSIAWSTASINVTAVVRFLLSPTIDALSERSRASISPKLNIPRLPRSEEHTSELQSLMRTSYDVFCLTKKTEKKKRCNY